MNPDGIGTFSIAAPRAERVELCVMTGATEKIIPLPHVDQGIHWGPVEGLTEGTRYGLRVHGPWNPERGLLFNPAHIVIDPYAHGVAHDGHLSPALFHHTVDSHLRPRRPRERATTDNRNDAILSVVTHADPPPSLVRPAVAWHNSIIYEAHVRGFTLLNPALPPELRGTYAGLGAPSAITYLQSLGITAVQLLPIHAKLDEVHLNRAGLSNYWGYNTLSFFAPEPSYATQSAQTLGSGAVLREVQDMVASLHDAGIEVFLDVVYNHTGEGDADDPIVGLRGIDAEEYYWRNDGHLVDVTGTGNTLNMRSPHVVNLVMRSLRFWVQTLGVDGFRFDLAAPLGRSDSGFHADHPLLRAMQMDPALAGIKLIAEPWDVGSFGWQTGNFPPGFAEWNDAFRDDVRGYWLTSARDRVENRQGRTGWVRDIATRLTGSADIFSRNDPQGLPYDRSLRAPWASVNFVTAHDGLTLHDLTAYNDKHNEANGEGGVDGPDNNRSFNHGVEGPTDDPVVLDARDHAARNMVATLLLSAGVPMLTAGDEFLRTQHGNNNAYCQDTEVSHVAWDGPGSVNDQRGMTHRDFVRSLVQARSALTPLRATEFFTRAQPDSLRPGTVEWFRKNGRPLEHDDWFAPNRLHILALFPAEDSVALLAFSQSSEPLTFVLPGDEWIGHSVELLVDSSLGGAELDLAARTLRVNGPTVVAMRAALPESARNTHVPSA